MTMDLDLSELVDDFGKGFQAADALRPQAISARSGKQYSAGLGPHGENAAVQLVVARMKERKPDRYGVLRPVPYPNSRLRCDLGLGDPLAWAIEVKMARAFGDNGKLDDTYLKDLLSPYEQDHSAVGDAFKLASSGFTCRRAVLVYGFDYDERHLDPAIDALERLAASVARMGPRVTATVAGLVHPVHARGRVVAWEVLGRVSQPADPESK